MADRHLSTTLARDLSGGSEFRRTSKERLETKKRAGMLAAYDAELLRQGRSNRTCLIRYLFLFPCCEDRLACSEVEEWILCELV